MVVVKLKFLLLFPFSITTQSIMFQLTLVDKRAFSFSFNIFWGGEWVWVRYDKKKKIHIPILTIRFYQWNTCDNFCTVKPPDYSILCQELSCLTVLYITYLTYTLVLYFAVTKSLALTSKHFNWYTYDVYWLALEIYLNFTYWCPFVSAQRMFKRQTFVECVLLKLQFSRGWDEKS